MKKKNGHHSQEFCLKSINEDMQWFPFKGIMLLKENNINILDDNLQWFLKLFSMLKLRIWYNENIFQENVLDSVGIMYVNCSKIFVFC